MNSRHARESGHPEMRDEVSGGLCLYYHEQKERDFYTGVTSDLVQRVSQHRNGVFEGFSKKHGLKTLVWYEVHDDINEAIRREKQIKKWERRWKLQLIEDMNPQWKDLYEV